MIDQTDEAALEHHITAMLGNKSAVIALLRAAFPRILAIYAFGSRIQGTARIDSDLDLAVLVAGYAGPLQLWELAGPLGDAAGCTVDLLDLRAASTVMQYQVLMHGQLLWGKQPDAGLFECFVLSEKMALDAARSGLLGDILKEGKIYGR